MPAIERREVGSFLSGAVVHNGVAYVSGQVCEGDTVAAQTAGILVKIDALLAATGSGKSALLSTSIWLADVTTFHEMNEVWRNWLPPGHAPARATVGAPLADPKYRVEIAVIAAVESRPS